MRGRCSQNLTSLLNLYPEERRGQCWADSEKQNYELSIAINAIIYILNILLIIRTEIWCEESFILSSSSPPPESVLLVVESEEP